MMSFVQYDGPQLGDVDSVLFVWPERWQKETGEGLFPSRSLPPWQSAAGDHTTLAPWAACQDLFFPDKLS